MVKNKWDDKKWVLTSGASKIPAIGVRIKFEKNVKNACGFLLLIYV